MHIKSLFIIKEFISFLKNPSNEREIENNIFAKLKYLFILFLLGIAIVIVCRSLLEFLPKLGIIEIKDNLFSDIVGPMPIWKKFLFACVLIPIVEELGFRLHLHPGPFSISLFVTILFLFVLDLFRLQGIYFLITTGLFFIIITFSLRRFNIGARLVNYWKNNFKFIFYLTAFVFGLVHLFNFSISLNLIAYAPIITIPQFLLGLELGYIRLKAGIIWSMLLHSMINSVFLVLIPLLITTIFNTVNDYSESFIKNNDREVLEIKAPAEWDRIEFAKIDPKSAEFKFQPYRMLYVGRFDYLYQLDNSKNFPEYPFCTLENNYYFPDGYAKAQKDYSALEHFRINDRIKNWLESVFELPDGKLVYDSLGQKVFSRQAREIKDVGEVIYLQTMFLLKSSTATVTCVFPINDFKKYKYRFSQILSSVTIIPYTVHLAKEHISNFRTIDFQKPYFTWKEAVGFLLWMVVVIVFVRMKNYNKITDLKNT